MASEKHLLAGARKATGDDTIDLVGMFSPKGMAGKEIGGFVAGEALGRRRGQRRGRSGGRGHAGRGHRERQG